MLRGHLYLTIIGVGGGGGYEFNPNGKPSQHSKSCGDGYIGRTYTNAGANFNVGLVSIGPSGTFYTGNGFEQPVGGDFYKSNIEQPVTFNIIPSYGVDYGTSHGIEIGSYTNW